MPTFKSLPHVGDPELHALGHELLALFIGQPVHRPTTYLTVHEHPERHYEVCPVCGYLEVPAGNFSLEHDYKGFRIERLPFLAAHVLAAHGVAGPREAIEVRGLRELLNKPERQLAERVVSLGAGADPEAGISFVHDLAGGTRACKHCGDLLNLGGLTLRRGGTALELDYLALHTLFAHRDPRWADNEGNTGSVDLDVLRALLDAGNDLVDLGERLASILPYLGGPELPPEGLVIDENPLRGSETCQRCNEHPNLGTFTLIHTTLNRQLTLPYLVVHNLRIHGMAHYVGAIHQGTVDVRLLERMLA